MLNLFKSSGSKERAVSPAPEARPELDLSGPLLEEALVSMLSVCEPGGGAERYVEALKFKASIFVDAFKDGPDGVNLQRFLTLAMFMPTVRRKAHAYFTPETYSAIFDALPILTDERTAHGDILNEFTAAFPDDREHRWVRDLGAEVLHNLHPERFPLMTRWVWDYKANTGVIREIWFGPNVDHEQIEVPDGLETFLALREDLAQYLTEHAVYRDVLYYVDLLCGHIYARYLAAQGGTLLRTEFGNATEDFGKHTRRILGLDGVRAKGDYSRDPARLEADKNMTKQIGLNPES